MARDSHFFQMAQNGQQNGQTNIWSGLVESGFYMINTQSDLVKSSIYLIITKKWFGEVKYLID